MGNSFVLSQLYKFLPGQGLRRASAEFGVVREYLFAEATGQRVPILAIETICESSHQLLDVGNILNITHARNSLAFDL